MFIEDTTDVTDHRNGQSVNYNQDISNSAETCINVDDLPDTPITIYDCKSALFHHQVFFNTGWCVPFFHSKQLFINELCIYNYNKEICS